MKYLLLSVLAVSLVGLMIPNAFADNVPEWIKNNAGWWATNQIDDNSFLQGIQYLIKEGIMVISSTEISESSGSQEVPSWIKNNADLSNANLSGADLSGVLINENTILQCKNHPICNS